MRFFCSACRVTFSIPDEKIPAGKELKILCPKCRVPVERKDEEEAREASPPPEPPLILPPFESEEDQESAATLEVVEEGVSTSLLCISDASRSEKIEQILKQLDYYTSTAGTARIAIDKLHRNRYDLVILDELYGATKQSENLVLYHIQLLPMHVRRQFFLCLLSETLPTLNQMLAFRIGVDMILNVQDLDKAKVILVRAIKDYKSFYRAYTEEMERKGQF